VRQADAVRLFALLYFVWGFWAAPYGSFVAIYLSAAGISDSAIGLLFGAASLAALFTAFPSGIISDRFNPRRVMLIGIVITAPFYLAITFTDSLLLLLGVFVIDSLAANLYGIAADSAMYRAVESAKGKAFGVIHLLTNLGNAISLVVCGYLISAAGFRGLGLLFMLVPASAMVLLSFRIPVRTARLERLRLPEYLREFRRREFVLFAAAVFLLAYHWGTERTSFPLYASNVLHLSSEQLGLLFGINLLFYAVGGFLAGRFVEASQHRARLFALGLALSAAGSLIYAFSYDFGSALLSRVLHDGGDAMLNILMMLAISALASRERTGGTVGAMAIIYLIAGFAGAVGSGYINQYAGYSAAITVSAILTLSSAALLALALKSGASRSPFPARS